MRVAGQRPWRRLGTGALLEGDESDGHIAHGLSSSDSARPDVIKC